MASVLRKVIRIGSSSQPPVKSCDDVNCSGSWNTPRIGPSEPQIGDIFSISMSIYTPFKTLLGVKLKDSESYYTAGGTKGARPCIIIDTRKMRAIYMVLLMASFDKSEEADVPQPFKQFLTPIPTSYRPIKGNMEHIHTTPEWESAPQYLVLIPVPCPKSRLMERWSSHKVDSSKGKFDFYLDDLALATLRRLAFQKRQYWEEKGKYELTREEYLKQLDKLKEEQTKSFWAKSQKTRSQFTGFKRSIR
uniref:Uncharacterized protein n=1 Tax=Moniliophthora roreri TaxID=221103 RepID=A0A0W0G0S7_MONRR